MIEEEDVLYVANRIGITDLTESEINQIMEEHDARQTDDPSATWDLVVENQIYDIR